MMVLAWIAPWLLGMGTWLALCGRPRGHASWCTLAGGGWLAGMLLLGWLLLLFDGLVSPQHCVQQLGPWLAVAGAALAAGGWYWRKAPEPLARHAVVSRFWWAMAAILLALLAWHAWLLFDEARLRPLFPWDAWLAWSVKPKTWFGLDQWVPFVDFSRWLTSASPSLHTDVVPAYPEMLARLEVWFASGAGCWCDPAFTTLWPALWLAMLLGTYGMLRGLGCRLGPALLATYALGSLPILNTHAALAGYADLWVAAVFGLTLLCWLQWQRKRHVGALVLSLLMGLSLPTLKVEGGVWMLLWLTVLLLGLLPRHWRRGELLAGLALLAVVALGVAFGGVGLPLPGIGWVHVDANQLLISDLNNLSLGWHPVTGAVARSLLVMPNWHLLFWLTPLLLIWRQDRLRHSTGLGLMALCLLGGVAFLFVLFFLTGAGAWASDFTSINRLLLQMVPALVYLLALLFVDEAATATT
ncbi:MAG: hypothetical protein WBW92_13845 [Rhodanobacteraceae bacterium]